MRALLLLLMLALSSGARGQSIAAVSGGERTFVLYEDGTWKETTEALPADRTLPSLTGRFLIRVPQPWIVSPANSETIPGEIKLAHPSDSAQVTLSFFPSDRMEEFVPGLTPEARVGAFAAFFFGLGDPPSPEKFVISPVDMRTIDEHPFRWQTIRETVPGEEGLDATLHLGILDAEPGFVVVMAATQPGADPEQWQSIADGLEILPASGE